MLDLKLRNFRDDDFNDFHAAMSNYDVVKMTGSWPWPPDPAFTRWRMTTPQALAGQVQVIDLHGIYIGQVSVVNSELGYMIAKPHWGQGVASWAVKNMLQRVFDKGAETITAGVWADNPASIAVLSKYGFVKTAEAVEFCKPRGHDLLGYSFVLNRADWVENI